MSAFKFTELISILKQQSEWIFIVREGTCHCRQSCVVRKHSFSFHLNSVSYLNSIIGHVILGMKCRTLISSLLNNKNKTNFTEFNEDYLE